MVDFVVQGHTPLLLAIGKGRTTLAAMMVALSDAEPGVVTKSGMSAIELAKIGKVCTLA